MQPISIITCPRHQGDCVSFCHTCKVAICPKCKGCVSHRTEPISAFMMGRQIPPMLENTGILLRKLRAALNETHKLCEAKEAESVEVARVVELKRRLAANQKDAQERECGLAEAAGLYLAGVEERAGTLVLQARCREAAALFCIKEEIHQEIQEAGVQVERLRVRADELAGEKARLDVEVAQLTKVKEAARGKRLDGEGLLALHLLIASGTIEESGPARVNTTVDRFRAFRGVETLFAVGLVKHQEMVDVGEGVSVSTPLPVPTSICPKGARLRTGRFIHASLSHHGVLAVGSYIGEEAVQLTDLVGGSQALLLVEHSSLVGFFDESLVLLTTNRALRVGEVTRVMRKHDVSALEVMGDSYTTCYADVSRLQATRVLPHLLTSRVLCEYNVDTKVCTRVETAQPVQSIVTTTGIDMGVRCLFQTWARGFSLLSLPVCGPAVVTGSVPDMGNLVALLPSTAAPSDVGKTLKIHSAGASWVSPGSDVALSSTLHYKPYVSIIRLFQNFFLVFDEKVDGWVIVRIRVL